jgi:hypothetical protein
VADKPFGFFVVGIGGVGKTVLSNLRRFIAPRLEVPAVPAVERLVTFNYDSLLQAASHPPTYALKVQRFVSNACDAGYDDELAWKTVALCSYGDAGTRFGCDIANTLRSVTKNDSTLLILALLPDVEARCEAYLLPISARQLDPRVVVITTTYLKHVERAFGSDDWLQDPAFPFPHAQEQDDTRLQSWLSLLMARLLIDNTCRRLQQRSSTRAGQAMVRTLLRWILGQPPAVMRERLLEPLWRSLPKETEEAAAEIVKEEVDPVTLLALLLSAIDGLIATYDGTLQRAVPQFKIEDELVRYKAPSPDPWPHFGEALADVAATKPELREWLRQANRQLRAFRR